MLGTVPPRVVVGHGHRVKRCADAVRTFGIGSDKTDGVSKWESERLPFRRGLRYDSFMDEALRSGGLGIGVHDA